MSEYEEWKGLTGAPFYTHNFRVNLKMDGERVSRKEVVLGSKITAGKEGLQLEKRTAA